MNPNMAKIIQKQDKKVLYKQPREMFLLCICQSKENPSHGLIKLNMYVCGVRKSALPENYPAGEMPTIRKFKGLMTFVNVVSVHVYSAAIICSYKY